MSPASHSYDLVFGRFLSQQHSPDGEKDSLLLAFFQLDLTMGNYIGELQ